MSALDESVAEIRAISVAISIMSGADSEVRDLAAQLDAAVDKLTVAVDVASGRQSSIPTHKTDPFA
jgi:hypothetical protein